MTIENDYLRHSKKTNDIIDREISKEFIGISKEKLLITNIKNIAQECQVINQMKDKFVKVLRSEMEQLDFTKFIDNINFLIKENYLKTKVSEGDISGLNIVSVDGSFVLKKFLNVDFSFLKAIAVRYQFSKNYDAKIKYFPDISGYNNYQIKTTYTNRGEIFVDTKISMDLRMLEIKLLNQLIQRSDSIDLIILDGSIVPMPLNNLIFSEDHEINQYHSDLIKEHRKLYQNCRDKKIILIGSIKDTRTTEFCTFLKDAIMFLKPNYDHLKDFIELNYRKGLTYFIDSDLFYRFLDINERSSIFLLKKEYDKFRHKEKRTDLPFRLPINFYAYYLKTVPYDTPCRIEFYMDQDSRFEDITRKANTISSIILPISNYNKYYGLPIPQIEAHRRAVFKSGEVEILYNSLKRSLNKFGINLLEKKRNRRPF
ncbi:MAG: DNA double-strand break repair nuclease NurA [Candidatus Lokiarchaeota archaeon]